MRSLLALGLATSLACLSIGNTVSAGYLHDAVKTGNTSRITYLIENGANINEKDHLGYTALHWAIDAPIMKILIDAGADVNANDNAERATPVHRAVFVATQIAPRANADEALDANAERIRALVSFGANLELTDFQGLTPLIRAAWDHQYRAVDVLIASGANVNVKTSFQETPLHFAAAKDVTSFYVEQKLVTIGLLVEAGADIGARDLSGMTPGDYISAYQKHVFTDRASRTGRDILEILGVNVE